VSTDLAVELARKALETAFWLSAPILLVATAVSLFISIVQVLTSVQDATVSTVPRLLAVGIATFLLMPWFLRKLLAFSLQLFSDFHHYLG
jgi:flagellar biosynthetic protein FliQ